jgi:hypothetical protein
MAYGEALVALADIAASTKQSAESMRLLATR